MSDLASVPAPVLVYNRIDRNRHKTWMLIALSAAAVLPFILGISLLMSAGVVWRVRSQTRQTRSMIRFDQGVLKRLNDGPRTEWTQQFELDLEARRAALVRMEAEDRALTMKLLPVFACALLAAMGLVFWAIASEPTSKLLVQAGANPAGDAEHECKRLLENLAIGAGLPPPKLYIIESSVPNAFAAGMDPQHAVIAVTRGALNLLTDKRELEGVLAHELSHIGNQDIRLNTMVASIALFLRIPYLMFRREMASNGWMTSSSRHYRQMRGRMRLGLFELALSPIGIYILFVAPILAALIRAAMSREREFLADADAALLTRYPEGLMRALAKIGGAGSAVSNANPAFAHFYFADPAVGGGWFSGKLLATHPPISERLNRLLAFQGAAGLAGLEEAVKQGKRYTAERPTVGMESDLAHPGAHDELTALNQGNLMGRVYRVVVDEIVPVYDLSNKNSAVIARVKPGSLIVVFDDPGKMRQINTADQTFGYIDRAIKLSPVNHVVPAEVYDPKMRAAAEAALPPLGAIEAPQSPGVGGLTRAQLVMTLGFGGAVFAGVMMLLLVFGK